MIIINVITNNIKWKNFLKNPNIYIEKKIKELNKKNKTFKNKKIFCTLLLSGNNQIKKLNKKFRNKNASTDVLSFPFYSKKILKNKLNREKEIYLGDIIINYNKINYGSNIEKFKFEFDKLWIHGLVHLFGHDHKSDRDFFKMQKIEKKLLSYLL